MLLILLGGVVPLLMLPGLLMRYDSAPKFLLTELACAVVLAFQPVRQHLLRLWQTATGRGVILLAMAQMAWFGVASALSVRPAFSVFGSSWRQFGLITTSVLCLATILAAAALREKPERLRTLLQAMSIAGIIASVYCITQYFDIDPFQQGALYHDHAGDSVIVRPPGTMGHADYFAWWLAIEFFCGMALATVEAPGLWRNLGYTATGLTGLATLLTGTRSAWVAVTAGLLIQAAASRPRLTRSHALAAALLTITFAGFLFSPGGTRFRARLQWSVEEPVGGGRPVIWRDSLRMALARPVTGYGPETFQTAFLKWQSEDLAHLFPDFHQESPHNTPLDALTSAGIPGLILTLSWFALGVIASVRALRAKHPAAAPLAAAFAASAAAAMFNAIMFGPALATALILAALATLQPARGASKLPSELFFKLPAWTLAAALFLHAVVLFRYENALAEFRKQPGLAALPAIQDARLPGASEDLYISRALANTCRGLQPVEGLTCMKKVLESAVRATETADDAANAWYSLAFFSANSNDLAGTERGLRQAAAIAPNWFKPHWSLARLLAGTGRLPEAQTEGARAMSLDHGRHAEVAQTLKPILTAAQPQQQPR